jgi:release factor glutamine methyltransferase
LFAIVDVSTGTEMKDPRYHLNNQAQGIAEIKRRKGPTPVRLAGMQLTALPNVYGGWLDSELMCEVLRIAKGDTLLDLCTGTGVVAIKAAQMGAGRVIAVDLNPEAVKNAKLNAQKFKLHNMEVREGSLFDPVEGMQFDVIVINPPYVNHVPADKVEICFWDEGNKVTKQFFHSFKRYLKPGGRAFLGWGDFADQQLLKRLSKENDVTLRLCGSKTTPAGTETSLAYELL